MAKLDRSAFKIQSFKEADHNREEWLKKLPKSDGPIPGIYLHLPMASIPKIPHEWIKQFFLCVNNVNKLNKDFSIF